MGDYARERCRHKLMNHYLSLATVQVPDKPDFMLAAEMRWAREQKMKERRIRSILHKHKRAKNNAKSKAMRKRKHVWFEIDGPRPDDTENGSSSVLENKENSAPQPKKMKKAQFVSPVRESSVTQSPSIHKTAGNFQKGAKLKPQFPQPSKLPQSIKLSAQTDSDMMQFLFGPDPEITDKPFVANLSTELQHCSKISGAKAKLIVHAVCGSEKEEVPAVQEAEQEGHDLLKDSSERAENVSIYFTSKQWNEMGDYARERCRHKLMNHYLSLATVQVPDKPDFMLAAEMRWAREQKMKERRIRSILHKHKRAKNNAKSKAMRKRKHVWFEIDGPRPDDTENGSSSVLENKENSAPQPKKMKKAQFVSPVRESSVTQSPSIHKTAGNFQKGAKLKPQFPQPSKLPQSIKLSAQTDSDMMQFLFGPDPEITDKPFVANLSTELQHCSKISGAKAKLIVHAVATESDQQSDSVDVAASPPSALPSSTRYPRRVRKAVNYAELENSDAVQLREADDDDDFEHVWCYGCKDFAHGGCNEHLMLFVFDNLIAVSGTPDYCTQSVPSFLSIEPSKYKEARLDVWVDCHLPAGVAFGPYRGRLCTNAKQADKSGYSWQIIKEDQPTSSAKRFFIDGEKMDISNWMRFVNFGYKESDCNVRGILGGEEVWYVLTKAVNPGTELLIHYGDDYVKHTRRAHLGRKFPCPVCDHVAESSNKLDRHERLVHRGEGRDHVCPECNKGFSNAIGLECHMRTHTGEKPFVCNVCAKGFSVKCNLKRHQLVHSGEQPFACKECGQSFNQSQHLERHQRIHTGEKPYKCKWCDKRFKQSTHLTTHERTHTVEKPFQVPDVQL